MILFNRLWKRSIFASVALAWAMSSCGGGGIVTTPVNGAMQFQSFGPPASLFPTMTRSAPTGITGNLITDIAFLAGGAQAGAVFDQTSGVWTPIVMPSSYSTATYGPALTSTGYRLVGNYTTAAGSSAHGFFYDSTTGTYTTIDPPAAYCAPYPCDETIAHSSYGSAAFKVVGNSDSTAHLVPALDGYPTTAHAFMYDSATTSFTRIDIAGALSTTAYGIWIDGQDVAVAGGYTDAKGTHAYVRDLTSGTIVPYDFANSIVTHFEGITGAGGAGNYNVVGDAISAQSGTQLGFFLPIRNWQAGTPIPLATMLSANSVFARTVIGVASVTSGGFMVNVPGP